MTELYLDSQAVDIDPGLRIAMTYQVNDIGELNDRQANYSNTIKLPYTPRNIRVLGALKDLNILHSSPYAFIEAKVVQDGAETVANGEAIVRGAGPSGYSLNMVSGNRDIFRRIKGKKLTELDLSAYNLRHTRADAIAGRTATTGALFAFIDFGHMKYAGNFLRVDLTYPSVFVHNIIEAILTEAGLTYEGDIFTDLEYLQLITPCNKFEYASGTGLGGIIDIAASLPGITQGDFLKAVMQHFGLTLQIQPYSRIIKFWKMSSLSPFNAVDWDSKVVGSPEISYKVQSYAQKNLFKYKQTSETGGDLWEGEVLVSNEMLKELRTAMSSKVTASLRRGLSGPFPLRSMSFIDTKYDFDEGTLGTFNNLYLFSLQRMDFYVEYQDTGPGGVVVTTDIPDAYQGLSDRDLTYSYNFPIDWPSLISRHYGWLEAMLTDSRAITVPVLLTPADIADLDHSKAVYLLGEYFYLNKVSNYLPGEVTNVDLIRL